MEVGSKRSTGTWLRRGFSIFANVSNALDVGYLVLLSLGAVVAFAVVLVRSCT